MRRIALALVLGAVFAGCGETIDEKDLEAQLQTKLAPDGGAVDCPGGQEVEKGRTFDCTLTAPGGRTKRVAVTLTDDEGGFEASEKQ
jgi:uncharacterized protein DUF4333